MIRKFITLFLIPLLILSSCQKQDEKTIVVADGLFAEVSISAHMAKYLIEEHTDYKVKLVGPIANTLAYQELKSGGIDVMPSYDGSLLVTFMRLDPGDIPEGMTVYDYAQKKGKEQEGVQLLDKFGHQNTYIVAISDELYKKHSIEKVSELIDLAPQLTFGAEHGFFDDRGRVRFKPFTEFYGLKFKESHSIDIGLKYAALDSGQMDVTLVYTSDGLNKKYNVKLLEDDWNFFPEYYKAYLVRDDFEEEFPGAKEALNLLANRFDEEKFMELNYQVDVEAKTARSVAKAYLQKEGLIE